MKHLKRFLIGGVVIGLLFGLMWPPAFLAFAVVFLGGFAYVLGYLVTCAFDEEGGGLG